MKESTLGRTAFVVGVGAVGALLCSVLGGDNNLVVAPLQEFLTNVLPDMSYEHISGLRRGIVGGGGSSAIALVFAGHPGFQVD